MPRTQSMAIPQTGPKDLVWEITKKTTPVNLLLPLLGTGLSYAAYGDDLGTSRWPFRIALLVTLFCIAVPFIAAATCRRTNLLWAYGLVPAIAMFSAYFFFGIVAYFYYFAFAPMPVALHWTGLSGGIALTLYWVVMSWRTVALTITKTTFVTRAFTENASNFRYQPQSAMVLFERLNKERSPFPKIYLYIVLGIAPSYLILERLLSSSFGTNGVLFALAVLGMPLSLWFAGVLVRIYLVMIRLPRRLQREHRKPVVVAE